MRKYFRAASRRFEQALIKAGILATPEEDAYYAWADQRLDELEAEARIARRLAEISQKEDDDPTSTWAGHNH